MYENNIIVRTTLPKLLSQIIGPAQVEIVSVAS